MGFFLLWLVAAIVVGVIASGKGRSGFGWFVLGVLISPLLAGILALVVSSKKPEREPISVSDGTGRKCPMCAEMVRAEAVKCRFCGADLQPQPELSADDAATLKYGG